MHALLIPVVVSLSLDTWAAALAVGLRPGGLAQRRRTGLLLAAAEALMALLGLGLGRVLLRLGPALDLGAAGLLAWLGLRELAQGRRAGRDGDAFPRTGATLALGLGVGLDEFSLGLGSAALGLPTAVLAPYVFVQAFAVSHIGFAMAGRFGRRHGEWAERVSAALFLVLAVPLLLRGLDALARGHTP